MANEMQTKSGASGGTMKGRIEVMIQRERIGEFCRIDRNGDMP